MLVAVLAGLSLFALLFLVAAGLEQRQEGLRLRLDRLRMGPREVRLSLGRLLGIERHVGRLKERMTAAGKVSDPEDFVLWLALGMVLATAVAIFYGYVLLAVMMPAVIWALGKHILVTATSRRTRMLEVQFKDFLGVLSLNLAIIPAFQPSFMRAARDVEMPLRQYTDRVVLGMQSDQSTEDALAVLRQIPSGQIVAWVDSILFAVRVKANLSAMCKRTADRLIVKDRMAKRIEAQAAQSKSLMVSMAGVTLFMMVATILSSPEFVEFYSSPIGRTALTGGILSFAATTFFVLRRIDLEMAR